MSKRSLRTLLFALCLALLAVVSARVSPGAWRTGDGATEADIWPSVEPTPEPTYSLEEELPGVDLTEWNLLLVNSANPLPPSFAPASVRSIREGIYNQYFDSRALGALEAMLDGAEAAGYEVYVRAAYRPYKYQATMFYGRATVISEEQGIEYAEAEQMARSVVAYPGTSEHQTGLCADIMDSASTRMDAETADALPVLQWLREHCAEYGFIYRYPKEKEELTGWYEPWHFRYVGPDAAAYIMDNSLCLEEFVSRFS